MTVSAHYKNSVTVNPFAKAPMRRLAHFSPLENICYTLETIAEASMNQGLRHLSHLETIPALASIVQPLMLTTHMRKCSEDNTMNTVRESVVKPQGFNGAALIDAQGREIPITEQMIQQACERLENAWSYPNQRKQHQAG